jgi:hypothetical protein
MQFVGVGEKNDTSILIITGESAIDRTEYGMSPSSKIGNVVDFDFEIELELEN